MKISKNYLHLDLSILIFVYFDFDFFVHYFPYFYSYLHLHQQIVFHSNKHHSLLFSSLHHMTMPLIQYIYTKQRFLIYFEYQKKTTMHTQHTFNDIFIHIGIYGLYLTEIWSAPLINTPHLSPVPPYVLF